VFNRIYRDKEVVGVFVRFSCASNFSGFGDTNPRDKNPPFLKCDLQNKGYINQRKLVHSRSHYKNILILDGAMGTMLQRYNFSEEDFRGERFKDFPHSLKETTIYCRSLNHKL
jgi:hypothetical protein